MEIGELLLLTAYQVRVCRTQVLSTQKLMTITHNRPFCNVTQVLSTQKLMTIKHNRPFCNVTHKY